MWFSFLLCSGIAFEFLWRTSVLWAVVAQMHFSQVLLYSCAVHITSLFLKPIRYLSSHTYFPPTSIFWKELYGPLGQLLPLPFSDPFQLIFSVTLAAIQSHICKSVFFFLKHLPKQNYFLALYSNLFLFCLAIFFHHCNMQFNKISICKDRNWFF